ncbi:autism susceptibility gene 2 protein isoform X4 [Callorhinchus milii]|uniref:autism susceptibility gene 2 protein isoform X4 n=1 Tax=Callorhinchus milii TaxID=7868 RepID=UPI0004575D50|nr:autism susceptibility gene 2 protein isoform X4 [Callorhinchus milii]|eukprot:gi/632967397/ref/XP_007899956.1/ PREDICTED: fibrosin-1-like protein isoform X4 [Callorhinchus milii]
MEGPRCSGLKQSRRSRSQRDRVRRREAASRNARPHSPSSGSEREGKGRNTSPGKTAANPASSRSCRPPRRKRRASSSQEEDIIDGFAIASFTTLEALEKDLALRPQERNEKWEKQVGKKPREVENGMLAEPSENGHENGNGTSDRERDQGRERTKKKVPLKNFTQMKVSSNRNGRNSEDDSVREANSSQRSSSRDKLSDRENYRKLQEQSICRIHYRGPQQNKKATILSTSTHNKESSAHSFSGRGYSCDSESDIDDKASDVGSEKLFSPAPSKGSSFTGSSLTSNEKPETKRSGVPKISGLERSQEQSKEVPFIPLVPSPPPPVIIPPVSIACVPHRTASPAVKEVVHQTQPRPRQPTPQLQPPQVQHPPLPPVHPQLPAHHQIHHQLPFSSLNSISSRSSSASSAASISLPKHLTPSPQIHPHHSATPVLPLSIPNLATSHNFSLRPPTLPLHHAMFATPATLPPPPPLTSNSLVVPGHPAGPGYSDTSLLISFNQPIMYCQPQSGILIGALSQASLLPPPLSPHVENHHSMTCRNRECQFEKYAPKIENPFYRHSSIFPSYAPTMPGMPPMIPHSGPFGSLQGAFQPKTSNPIDVASRQGAVPHTLLQKDPRLTDPYRQTIRLPFKRVNLPQKPLGKPGKWCAVHVQIAWQIYHHQQKMKQQMSLDHHKLELGGKLDLFSRPPAPGMFPGFSYPHDLARPLFSTTGNTHPAASPFGPQHHPHSFLPTGHLADPFSRANTFSGLGNLSTSAFGGLGNPALASNAMFGHKEGPGVQSHNNPHEPWNRLHRTPPSFPTPPQWPKPGDSERSSSVTNHDRDRETEKRDTSLKSDRDKERDGVDKNRHSNRSSPASAPVNHQINNLIHSNSRGSADQSRHHGSSERDRSKELEREHTDPLRELPGTEHKIKENHSPVKEGQSHERRLQEENAKPVVRTSSPYNRVLSEGLKLGNSVSKESERKPETLCEKVKNDVKIKEERKEDNEVMVIGSDTLQHARSSEPLHHPSLHGLSLAHTMGPVPITVGNVHQMNNMNMLDRSRMVTPFIGPLAGRERLAHPGFSWDPVRDPLRDAYRSLDFRRMEFPLRADHMNRFPTAAGFFEHDRSYRDREPHDYNHEHLLEARREHERLRQHDERERLHLREEFDRARLHALHTSAMDSHLAQLPTFMPHLSGMHYPRLSPSTANHNGILNRTPPTAALSAPPPLVPAGTPRSTSPRRTTPLTNSEATDYSPSRNPKEVEAR